MRVVVNTKKFEKRMNNIIDYSIGFLDGVQKGKKLFLSKLGNEVIFALGQYIDVNARANPKALHHVYEWYQTGSPDARLFNLTYTVSNVGLSFNSNFRQSRSIPADGNVPFANKAKIMEDGIPVVIKPKRNSALVFEDGGQTIFVKKPITVREPGGSEVVGSYERIFDEFFIRYFKQSFLRSSGLYDYIKRPTAFKKNIAAGAVGGKAKGIETGFKWIANARIGVE